jgi:hypothetical protein
MDLVYRAAYEKCREISRPDLYYLGDLLDDTKTPLYRGVAHLNATGNQIAADRLFQILENPPNQAIAKNSVLGSKTRSAHLTESRANQTEP